MSPAGERPYRYVEPRKRGDEIAYVANPYSDGKCHYAGFWTDAREAAIAVDRAALFFGTSFELNEPEESRRRGPASPEELKALAKLTRNKIRGACEYFGVTLTSDRRYRAQITIDGRTRGIALFDRAEDAARGYDRVAFGMYGASARLNFPDPPPKPASIAEIKREQGGRPAEDKSSRYRGVTWLPRKERYAAGIKVEKKRYALGNWIRERDAAVAYDRAALFFLGVKARLNFPDLPTVPASPEEMQREQYVRAKAKMSSRHRGVSRTAHGWHAYLPVGGGRVNIAVYELEDDAALAHDRAGLHVFGEDADLNFPGRRTKPASIEVLRAEHRAAVKDRFSSRYQGVYWSTDHEKWSARIHIGPKKSVRAYHLGLFDEDQEEEAARAYDRAALYFGRDPATLNFPFESNEPASPALLADEGWQRFKERTTSQYTGVFWSARLAAWLAHITIDGVFELLGQFNDEAEAARAYDRAAFRYRGNEQRPQWINFPEEWGVASPARRPRKRARAR